MLYYYWSIIFICLWIKSSFVASADVTRWEFSQADDAGTYIKGHTAAKSLELCYFPAINYRVKILKPAH